MNRLENLRQHVDHILFQLDGEPCRNGFVHLYGVSLFAVLLARKRGMDQELAAAAGMLHDISSHLSGYTKDHAEKSAVLAQKILAEVGGYGKAEIESICSAISHHSDKAGVHKPLDEVLKDADVLHHHFYNPALPSIPWEQDRLARLKVLLHMG